jgi:O-antigen ligase
VRVTFAVALAAVGVLLVALGGLGIADPAGVQHANDNEPFGSPPSRAEFALLVAIGLGLVVVAVAVVRRTLGSSRARR